MKSLHPAILKYVLIICLFYSNASGISNAVLINQQFDSTIKLAYDLYSNKEYQKALITIKYFIEYNPNIEQKELANLYIYLGTIHMHLGNYGQSLNNYNRAEETFDNLENKIKYIYYNKALIYRITGNYKKAIQILETSLYSVKSDDHYLKRKILRQLGVIHNEIGNYPTAINYLEQNIEITKKYKLPELDYSYNSCALAYQKIGDLKTAEEYFYKSIKYNKSNPSSHFPESTSYLNLGKLKISSNELSLGLKFIRKAIIIQSKTNSDKDPYLTQCYLALGKYYFRINDTDSALYMYQKALNSKVISFNNNKVNSNPKLDLIFSDIDIVDILKSKTEALQLRWQQKAILADLETEMNTHDLLVQLIDKMRINSLMNESKQDLHKRERNTYIKAMQVALELYHQTKNDEYQHKALQLADKLKYSSLMDDMQTARARLKAFVPDSILLTEINLQRRINAHHKLINETNDNDSLVKTNFKSNLFELYQKQDKLNDYVRDSFPDYYSLKNQINELDSRKLQRSLHRKETMLSYTLADSCMYIFVIARNNLSVSRQPLDSAFFKDIKVVKDYLTGKIQNVYDYQISAHRLYDQLLFPVKENINNHNIIIVPDDITGYLPFEVLLTHSPSDTNHTSFKEMPYLVHKYAIGYSYTASLWAQSGNMSARLSFQYPALSSLDEKWQVEQKDENVVYIPFLNEGIAQFAFNGNTTGTAFRNNQIDPKADIWAVLKKDYNRYMNKGERKSSAMRLAKLDYLSKVPSSGLFNAFGSNAYASPRYWAGYIVISNNNPQNRTPVKAVLLVLLFVLMLAFGMYYVLKPHWQTDQKNERIDRIGANEDLSQR